MSPQMGHCQQEPLSKPRVGGDEPGEKVRAVPLTE